MKTFFWLDAKLDVKKKKKKQSSLFHLKFLKIKTYVNNVWINMVYLSIIARREKIWCHISEGLKKSNTIRSKNAVIKKECKSSWNCKSVETT